MADVTVVIGVGPGLGAALARRFARGGHAVAALARSAAKVAPVAAAIEADGGRAIGVACDATDAAQVKAAFDRIRTELGTPSTLVYNASPFAMGSLLDLTPAQLEATFRGACTGALLAAQQVLPDMVAAGRGTVLLTGATASLRGGARFGAFAAAKFGLRALGQSMAREFGPQGVHVAHVVLDGQIDTPTLRAMQPDREPHTALQPDAIAEVYWQLHSQHPTAWTQELDLRPSVERF